ncbi:MAG: chitobiase/beta-hexosaminidase C-terminal domain-containing protein [Candidatus Aphodosoma sp.]
MKKLLLSFLVMLASVAMVNAMDTVYLHQFTAKPNFLAAGSTDSLSGIEWTISDSLVYTGFDTSTSLRGWQIGSSQKVQPSFSLSTNGITAPVNVIRLIASGASGANFKITVSVNGVTMIPDTINMTSTVNDTIEFTGLPNTGAIIISYVDNKGKAMYLKEILLGYETPATVEAPHFSVAEGTLFNPTKVAISTLTEDASIYYTLDGTEPTDASTLYTDSILVSATTTIKAVAVKDGVSSEVSIVTYNFPIEVANIAAFLAAKEQNIASIITGDVTVIFQNGGNTFVKDETGYILIYGDLGYHELVNGDVLSRVCGVYAVYNGIHELVPAKEYVLAEPTHGTAVTPEVRTISTITADDVNVFVALNRVAPTADVTFEEGTQTNVTLADDSEEHNTIVARSAFKQISGTFVAHSLVDVVGMVTLYKNAPQISIISINNSPVETAVENATVNANVYTKGNDILVETEAGNTIEVYNVQGQMIVNTIANEGINTISGISAGVAIVRVNGVSYKVIL